MKTIIKTLALCIAINCSAQTLIINTIAGDTTGAVPTDEKSNSLIQDFQILSNLKSYLATV